MYRPNEENLLKKKKHALKGYTMYRKRKLQRTRLENVMKKKNTQRKKRGHSSNKKEIALEKVMYGTRADSVLKNKEHVQKKGSIYIYRQIKNMF